MRILVAGDAMIDRYIFGDINRMSPEAPVPVLSVDREDEQLGAAANVARNIRAMGGEVVELFSDSFRTNPVVKLRLVNNWKYVCRIDWDSYQEPIAAWDIQVYARMCGIVVLCDYGKGALKAIQAIIYRLKQAGKKVFVDPKSRRARVYEGVDLLKPNLVELRAMIGPWDSEDELEHKVKSLQRQLKIRAVLLTRGDNGMTLYNGKVSHFAAYRAGSLVDVCGAGDTVMAAFATSVARGYTFEAAAGIANRAAGISVTRFGAAIVEEAEIFK